MAIRKARIEEALADLISHEEGFRFQSLGVILATQKCKPLVAHEKKSDLTCPCLGCGYKIPPAELLHVDGVNVRCPKCQLDSLYITRKPQMTRDAKLDAGAAVGRMDPSRRRRNCKRGREKMMPCEE